MKKRAYDEKKLVSRQDAAEQLGVSQQTISNYIERGVLSGIKRSNYTYVIKSSLDRLVSDSSETISIKKELEQKKAEYEKKLEEYELLLEELNKDTILAKATYTVKEAFLEAVVQLCGDDYPEREFTQRTAEILTMWLDGNDYTIISNAYGLTRERVRQLVMLGIHRLPKWKDYVRTKKEWHEFKRKCEVLEIENKDMKQTISSFEKELGKVQLTPAQKSILAQSVFDIGLSTRSVNCLRMNNVKTVFELTQLSRNDLMNMNQLGKKSALEIESYLYKNGLSLRK